MNLRSHIGKDPDQVESDWQIRYISVALVIWYPSVQL